MPLIPDYDEEDDTLPQRSGGGSLGGGRAAEAAPSPQREQAFVPWSRFVSANQEVSQREAGKLQSQVQSSVDKAKQGIAAADSKQTADIRSNYDYTGGPSSGSIAAPAKERPQSASFGATSSFGKPAPQVPQMGAQAPAPTQMTAPNAATKAYAPTPKPNMLGNAAVGSAAPWGQLKADALKTNTASGAPKTSGFGLSGAKDLQGALGADAWKSLLGDTMKAQNEADALGSTEGVQALLGDNATAFDAALIGGAGGKGFRDLSSKYGDDALTGALGDANENAVSQWQRLMGDVETAGLSRDREIQTATDEMNRIAAEQAAAAAAGASGPRGTQNPWGYGSYNDFLTDGGFLTDVRDAAHSFVNDTSLSNAAVDEAGKAGLYGGNNVAEEFRKGVGLGDDLDMQNIRGAFRDIADTYGQSAAAWLFENLTPEQWAAMQGNTGAMFRVLQQAIDAAIASGAFVAPVLGTEGSKASEVQAVGATNANADYGTTSAQETARTNAYRDGWGEEWDRQFREGNPNPEKD